MMISKYRKLAIAIGISVFTVSIYSYIKYDTIKAVAAYANRILIWKLISFSKVMQDEMSISSTTQHDNISEFVEGNISFLSAERESYTARVPSLEKRRGDLSTLIGVLPKQMCSGKPVLLADRIESNNDKQLFRIKVLACANSTRSLILNGLLAIPTSAYTNKGNVPLVVAIHGTGSGPEQLFLSTRKDNYYDTKHYHNLMGDRMIEHGLAVFSPQLITSQINKPILGYNEERNRLHMRLLPFGLTLHGVELTLISEAITAIHAASEFSKIIDQTYTGAYGISLGGATAFYLSALDTRIKTVVISQFSEDRDKKLAGDDSSSYWKFPSSIYVYQQGFSLKFDDTELLKLILPRSVFIEAGAQDAVRSHSAKQQFNNWTRAFPQEHKRRLICLEVADAAHEAVLNNSLKFLVEKLKQGSAHDFECN